MLVAFLGVVLILHVSSIAGHGPREYELPGGIKVVVVTPSQDSSPRPEHRRPTNQQGIQIIQLGGDNDPKYGSQNSDRDSNSDILNGLWDYLKHQNASGNPGSSGVQVIQLGSDNGPKESSHSDDDDSLRKIFKLFRFGSRRDETESHPNLQYVNLFGRDLGHRRTLAQDRSDYDYPSTTSQAAVPRTRVKTIRQNVPRRMLMRNLRSSQAHLTNMQTLSFPVYEDEWQIA